MTLISVEWTDGDGNTYKSERPFPWFGPELPRIDDDLHWPAGTPGRYQSATIVSRAWLLDDDGNLRGLLLTCDLGEYSQVSPPETPGPGYPADYPADEGVRVDAGADLAQLVDEAAAPVVELVKADQLDDECPHPMIDEDGRCDHCGAYVRDPDPVTAGLGAFVDAVAAQLVDPHELDEDARPIRRGAYGQPIPAGLCGAYWADEGGEHMCRRPVEHAGDHSPLARQEDFPSDPPAGTPLETSSTGNLPVGCHPGECAAWRCAGRCDASPWPAAAAPGVLRPPPRD